MIRILDGLVLLKEVAEIRGKEYSVAQIKKIHANKIVIIRHTAYIYKEVLCEQAQREVTSLDGYVPLGELVDYLSVQKSIFHERIDFMQKTGAEFFDYKIVCGMQYVKIDDEFRHLLENYQPFLAKLGDASNVVACRLLGDLKIGFY